MVPIVREYELYELVMLNQFKQKQSSSRGFGQEDGGAKDESLKEEKLNEYLSNKHK